MYFNSETPEFLIRKRNGDFALRQISSVQASLFFRPNQVSKNIYQVKEVKEKSEVSYLVKNITNGKITELSKRGFEIWNLMDGKTTMRGLAARCFLKYGSLDFSEVQQLVRVLKDHDLIEKKTPPFLRIQKFFIKSRNPLMGCLSRLFTIWISVGFKIANVDEKINQINRKIGWLFFNKIFIGITLALGLWASIDFGSSFVNLKYTPASFLDSPYKWLVFVIIFLIVMPIHELAHAVTAKYFGYRVREFGFVLLYHLFPVFYADVTDVWMAPPRQRMLVAAAGPFSTWILGAAAYSFSIIVPKYEFFFGLVAFNCYIFTLINLYPFLFLELDGFYIFIDLLKIPYLKSQVKYLKNIILKRHYRRLIRKENFVTAIYEVLSFISVVLVLGYIIWSFITPL